MTAESFDWFCSYSRQDAEFVLKLVKDLRKAGASLWLDQLDIVPGQPWDDAVESALVSCQGMLAVLSSSSVVSQNFKDEVAYALREGKQIIPVLYRECDIPFRLQRLQHVDFLRGYDKGLADLLRALKDQERRAEERERQRAGKEARQAEEEERQRAEEKKRETEERERHRAEEEARQAEERGCQRIAEEKLEAEEAIRREAEAAAARKTEEESKREAEAARKAEEGDFGAIIRELNAESEAEAEREAEEEGPGASFGSVIDALNALNTDDPGHAAPKVERKSSIAKVAMIVVGVTALLCLLSLVIEVMMY